MPTFEYKITQRKKREKEMAETLSKNKAKELRLLSKKKERDLQGSFIAEGEKCVIDLLSVFPLEYLLCTRDWLENNKELERKFDKRILVSDIRGLEMVSQMNSVPEVIGIFKKPEQSAVMPSLQPDKLYLLLDGIQDPGNLGTIIRTCDWFGVYDIFASKTTADVYSHKVVQSTMGSLTRVSVRYVDLLELVDNNSEIPLIGTLLDGTPLSEFKGEGKGFLIMGNEGNGLSDALKERLTHKVTIPPNNPENHPDSLNVAIATAICLDNLTRNTNRLK